MFNRGTSQAGVRAELSHQVFSSDPRDHRTSPSFLIVRYSRRTGPGIKKRLEIGEMGWDIRCRGVAFDQGRLTGTEFAEGYRTTDEEETVGATAWTATSPGVS